jgi:ADP-ribosylglycohydrolase
MPEISQQSRFRGVFLGTAVGDAVGLPAEGISRRRVAKWFPRPWRHRLVWRYGMLSDDTEQTLLLSQALLAHPVSSQHFARHLAWGLRWWLLMLPAGIGMATGRAIFRLWLGFPPHRSGVDSAGNGAAMRVAPIGALFSEDVPRMEAYVRAATVVTHSDPRACIGALAVAKVCGWCLRTGAPALPDMERYIEMLRHCGEEDEEWRQLMDGLRQGLEQGVSVQQYAERLGQHQGISGYVYRTVPVALFAWYRHFGDFEETVSSVLDCGGDTDTVGAIAGAMAGAVVGQEGIPQPWVSGIRDWPQGTRMITRVADHLAALARTGQSPGTVAVFRPVLIPRNLVFLLVVVLHGFRRLLPPY